MKRIIQTKFLPRVSKEMKRREPQIQHNNKSKSRISLHKHPKEKLPQFLKSIRISPKTVEDLGENPRLAGIFLPDKIHLISLAVVDFQFGEGC